jgi:hypothetical protein
MEPPTGGVGREAIGASGTGWRRIGIDLTSLGHRRPSAFLVDVGGAGRQAAPMADEDILSRINALVDEEHGLAGRADAAERRRELEEQLDQCWDLLRQRQARRESGGDPSQARARPVGEVENYLQ